MEYSDIPPIPARSVSGIKMVVMIVSRLTVEFVSLEVLVI